MTRSTFIFAALSLLSALPASAAPSITAVPRAYSPADGGIRWEVILTQHDPLYAGSLVIELPLTLTPHNGPPFIQFMRDAGAFDDANNGPHETWYYNETAPGSAYLVWNSTGYRQDHEQIPGYNPFTGGVTEGLWIDAPNLRLFASLASWDDPRPDALTDETNFPGQQVRVLHVVTSDGILNWTDAIVAENGVEYTGISGSADSIVPGDMSANGNRNQGAPGDLSYVRTGASQNPTTLLDISGFLAAAGTTAQTEAYAATHPGLNIERRGDCTGNGMTTLSDVVCFLPKLRDLVTGSGSEVGPVAVPEPNGCRLFVMAILALGSSPRRAR
jgi:hypothetical protein